MKKLVMYCFVLSLMLGLAVAVYAQEQCETTVDEVWTMVAERCANTSRNEVCYGNTQIESEGRAAGFAFDQVGDIVPVADVESLTLSSFDPVDESWGIAMMRLQANLPNTLPGQNVTVVAFGDVQLDNQVLPVTPPLSVTLTTNGRMRRTPDTSSNANVLTSVPSGTVLEAIGRDESATWVYTSYQDFDGWLSTQVLQVAGDVNTLNVIVGERPSFGTPMQAMVLRTGIGQPECGAVPDDGILIQTPQGVGLVTLTVNGVNVRMGSTLYLTVEASELHVYVLEGTGIVSALDTSQIVPAGTFSTIPLDESGAAPAGIPSQPQPYDAERIAALPVQTLDSELSIVPEPTAAADPLPADEIDAAIDDYKANLTLEPGTYLITRTEAVIRNGTGNCPLDATFTREHDGNPNLLFGTYARLPDGRFGANDADLDVARNPDSSYIGEANQITLTGPTTFTWFTVSNGNGSPAYCEFRYTGVRIG